MQGTVSLFRSLARRSQVLMLVSIGKDRPFTDMFVGRQNGDVSVHA